MNSRTNKLVIASLIVAFTNSFATGAAVSFRDGFPAPFGGGIYAGTDDTMLVRNPSGAGSRHNFGARPDLQVGYVPVGNSAYERHGLVRFDVTSLAGRFSSIDSVTLRLFVTNTDAGLNGSDISGSGTLEVFEVATANRDWEEGTGVFFDSAQPVTPGMTTWDQRLEGVENWAGSPGLNTVGVDYLAPVLASRSFREADAGLLEGSAFDFTLNDTSLIANWISGGNAGLLFRTQNPNADNSITFFTNNALDPALRPELIVEFTPVPEPASSILLGMVVAALISCRRRRGATTSSIQGDMA